MLLCLAQRISKELAKGGGVEEDLEEKKKRLEWIVCLESRD